MLAPWAAATCSHLGKMWPSLGAFALPFLNFDFLRPVRMSAAYFPAWFVTGEVEASLIYKGVEVRTITNFLNFESIQFLFIVTGQGKCLV
jgi:hypothetical protein